MQKHDTPGTNRSGSTLNPSLIQTQLAFAESVAATPVQGSENIKTVRMQYIAHADVVGSPAPLLNQDSALGKALSERSLEAQIFADKLGQRLAFERSGVRLYEALMDKVLATEFAGKPELTADIGHICQEETEHFLMLKNIMEYLGADPTAITPAANVSGVAAQGFLQVITDPRTTLPQCLEAMLSLELTDSTCWEHLIEAADKADMDAVTENFRQAAETEKEHVQIIEKWLKAVTYV